MNQSIPASHLALPSTPRHAARALLAAVAFAVALGTTGRAQDRVAVPIGAPQSPVAGQTPLRNLPDNLTPHTLHQPTVLPRLPEDDRQTAELDRDPEPGHPGDLFGQEPVRPYLLGNAYRLSFLAGDHVPPAGERIDPELVQTLIARNGEGETYGFVMFEGRITTGKRARIEAIGVRLFDHHTFNCMTAAIPLTALGELAQLDCVRWIGYARPWQKIDPMLAAEVTGSDSTNGTVRVFVKVYRSDLTPQARRIVDLEAGGTAQAAILETFRTIPEGACQRAFEGLGARVIDYHDELQLFALELPATALGATAQLDFVHSIELDGRIEPGHDRSTRQVGVDYVRSISTNDGHDTVVGMMDSGMDLTHTDVNSHWYAGWGYDGQSPYIDSTGHGTHVMGTVSGTGQADSRYMGCAPQSGSSNDRRIYIAGIYDGPSANSTTNNAINAFARFATPITISNVQTPIPSVINHSWGNGSSGIPAGGWVGTDSLSIALDYRVFTNRQTHVVCAHNQGGASYANQNLNTVLKPAVAKMSLTVASCLDFQENGSLPGRPYFTSNKGPTGDGRLCPQVMAPGRFVRSVQAGTTNGYVSFQGTSMATPHVTGTIAGLHTHYPWMKQNPAVTRAVIAATTNPYGATRTFTSSSDSYYHRQGFGVLDAYKAHYQRNEPGGFLAGRVYGTLDSNDGGAYFDIDVPADAERTLFVLAFDEKPASQSATRACVHDLDLHLDVEPFDPGYNTGEFHATRAWDSWDWYGNVATIGQLQGKRVRVKIHPRVAPTGNDVVRYGVAYLIPRGDTTPNGTLDVTTSKTILQPNEVFNFNATVDVPEYVQSNTWVALALPAAVGVNQLSFVDRGDLPRVYTGGSTPLDWTLGVQGHWFGTSHRRLTWQLQAPSSNGTYTLCANMEADNLSSTRQDCVAVCVDNQAPFLIGNVSSPTHPSGTWVNSTSFQLAWTPTSDVGCAGMAGYSYSVAYGAPTTPGTTPMIGANAGTLDLQFGTNGQDRYVALRAIDNAGNATNRVTYGPVRVDTVNPSIGSLTIDGGATFTSTTSVLAQVGASDAHSGLATMRWSWNGVSWSSWTAFSASPFAVGLGSVGGNTDEGSKTLRMQVRDVAGNVSSTATASIIYLRCPSLRTTNRRSLPNVTQGYFEITGTDLLDITSVSFGPSALTVGSEPPFGNGWCEIVDDSRIRIHPPQALAPGTFAVIAQNRACRSNALNLDLVFPTAPALATASEVDAGSSFRVYVSRGPMPATTQIGMTASPLALPSVAPGVVSLALGAQFGALLLFPDLHATDPATRATQWTVPSVPVMAGSDLFVQAFLIDVGAVNPLPASTSNLGTIAFN